MVIQSFQHVISIIYFSLAWNLLRGTQIYLQNQTYGDYGKYLMLQPKNDIFFGSFFIQDE